MTGESTHRIEPSNAFQVKAAVTKGVMVRIYSGFASKEMQWVVKSSMRVLVFTKGKVVRKFIQSKQWTILKICREMATVCKGW